MLSGNVPEKILFMNIYQMDKWGAERIADDHYPNVHKLIVQHQMNLSGLHYACVPIAQHGQVNNGCIPMLIPTTTTSVLLMMLLVSKLFWENVHADLTSITEFNVAFMSMNLKESALLQCYLSDHGLLYHIQFTKYFFFFIT